MSAAKHTPGPWRLVEQSHDEDGEPLFIRVMAGRYEVANTGSGDFSTSSTERANALLIAAAPEMLDELQKAHRLLQLALKHMGGERQSLFAAESEREGLGVDGATRHHERAAVIAKATGSAQ